MEVETMPFAGGDAKYRRRRILCAGLCLAFAGAAITMGVAMAVVSAKMQAMQEGVAARRLLVDMSEDQAQARVTIDLDVPSELEGLELHELHCDLELPCADSSSLCGVLAVEAVEINHHDESSAQIVLEVPANVDLRALYHYLTYKPKGGHATAQVSCAYTVGLRPLGNTGPYMMRTRESSWPVKLLGDSGRVKFGHTASSYKLTPPDRGFHMHGKADGFIHAEVPAGPFADYIVNFLQKTEVKVLADLSYTETRMDTFQFAANTRGSLVAAKSSSGSALISIPVDTRSDLDLRAVPNLVYAVAEGEGINAGADGSGSDTEHSIKIAARKPRSWMAQVMGSEHQVGLRAHGQHAVRRLKEIADYGVRRLSGKDKIQRGIMDMPFSSFNESLRLFVDQQMTVGLDLSVTGGNINKVILGSKNTYFGQDCSRTCDCCGCFDVCSTTTTDVLANITMDVDLDKQKVSGRVDSAISNKKNQSLDMEILVGVDFSVDFPNLAMSLDVDLDIGAGSTIFNNSLKITADLDGGNGNKGSANIEINLPAASIGKTTATWIATEKTSTVVEHTMGLTMADYTSSTDARKIFPGGFSFDRTTPHGSAQMNFTGGMTAGATMTEDKSVKGKSQMEVSAWAHPTCKFVPMTSTIISADVLTAAEKASCAECERDEWDSVTNMQVCRQFRSEQSCCGGILSDMQSMMNNRTDLLNKMSMNMTDGGVIEMPKDSPLASLLGDQGSQPEVEAQLQQLAGYTMLNVGVGGLGNVTFKFKSLIDMSLDVETSPSAGSIKAAVLAKSASSITSLTAAVNASGKQEFDLSLSGDESSSTSSQYTLKVSGGLSVQDNGMFSKVADLSMDTTFPRDLFSIDSAGAFHLANPGAMTLNMAVKNKSKQEMISATGKLDTVETASESKVTGAFDIKADGNAAADIDISLVGDGSKYDLLITEKLLASGQPMNISGTLNKASNSWSGDMALKMPGTNDSMVVYVSELSNGFLPATYDAEYGRLSMKAELGSQGKGFTSNGETTKIGLQWYLERSPYGERAISAMGMGVALEALNASSGGTKFSITSDTDLGMVVKLPASKTSPSSSSGVGSTVSFGNALTFTNPADAAKFDEAKYIEGMKAAITAEGNSASEVKVEKVEYKTQVAYSVDGDITEAAAKTALAATASVTESAVEVRIIARRLLEASQAEPRRLATLMDVNITTTDKTKVAGIAQDLADTTKVSAKLKDAGVTATPSIAIQPSVVVMVTTKLTAAGSGSISAPSATLQSSKLAETLGVQVSAEVDTSTLLAATEGGVTSAANPASLAFFLAPVCFILQSFTASI